MSLTHHTTDYDGEKSRDLEPGSPHNFKDAYGPGPADPYTTHDHDGKPIVSGDEMRIAGEFGANAFPSTGTNTRVQV
jgi:hypothetical protein